MGIRNGFRDSTVPVIVTFAVLGLTNVLSWVAFTTTSWAYLDNPRVNYQGYGLWRICATTGSCSLLDGTRSEWYAAFQACGVFGFAGLKVALFLLVMYMFVEWCQKDVELRAAAIVSCFVGVAGYITAVVVFSQMINGWISTPQDLKLGFSLWVAVAAIILGALSAAVLVLDVLLANRKAKDLNVTGTNSSSSSSNSNSSSFLVGKTRPNYRGNGRVAAACQSFQSNAN